MGWFSADEVISTSANSASSDNLTTQNVALCILAAVALGYGALKIFNGYNTSRTERVAATAARLQSLQSVNV